MTRKVIEGNRWKGGSKQYCAIVTLDVKNAFNPARWSEILNAMCMIGVPIYIRKMITSYFSARILTYDTTDRQKTTMLREGFHMVQSWARACVMFGKMLEENCYQLVENDRDYHS